MEKREVNVTSDDSKADLIQKIKWYAGRELIEDIRNIYEETKIPVAQKRAKRQKLTQGFINNCVLGFGMSKQEVEDVINNVIQSERWIEEIEEIDEIDEDR